MRRIARAVYQANRKKKMHYFWINDTLSNAANEVISLLVADDDPDYDISSNGTTIAECQTGSDIIKIVLNIQLVYPASGVVTQGLLFKNPDASILSSGITLNNLFLTRDYDQTDTKEMQRYAMKYFATLASAGLDKSSMRLHIKRSAMKRAGHMRDNDRLDLVITSDNAGNTKYLLYGYIVTAMP